METRNAVAALGALAQETRLSVFRLLVVAGPQGLAAGEIGAKLDVPPATLSFHLKELSHAGLVTFRQDGRFIYYSADYPAMSELISFLTEKCCLGMPAQQAARIGQAVATCCAPSAATEGKTKQRSAA